MIKKAYLVTFEITTRVIADVHDGFDPNNCNLLNKDYYDDYCRIEQTAIDNIVHDPRKFPNDLDLESIEEDTECPYGTFKGED